MSIKEDILSTLAYFGMFNYPLKKNEVFLFLRRPAVFSEFGQALDELVSESAVFNFGYVYSLDNCRRKARAISNSIDR